MLKQVRITTDGSGDGSGSTDRVRGFLRGIRVELGGTPAATTDITIAEADGLQRTLLTLTNYSTAAAVFFPLSRGTDSAGTAVDWYEPHFLDWTALSVTVAQGVASTADAVVITVSVESPQDW